MAGFVPISGPVIANRHYVENVLSAENVGISLPEVVPMTADLSAMGTLTMPIWQLLENMEAVITRIGLDKGLRKALTPEMKNHEIRWAQPLTDINGNIKNVGCKAFLKAIPVNLPGLEQEVGSPIENETRLTVVRYNLFVDGEEMWLIDRLAGICRINGKDYMSNINSML